MNTELTALVASADPTASIGSLTAQLRQLGYAAADIQAAYNYVASTSTLTPQLITYLQQENAKLQEAQRSDNLMWIGGGLIFFWLLSRHSRR